MASTETETGGTSTSTVNVDPLQSATVFLALDVSTLSYDTYASDNSTLQVTSGTTLITDPQVAVLTTDGWTQITGLDTQINTTNHYQGIAFYKVINGITEIVIANRGSQAGGSMHGLQDFVGSDGDLTFNKTPASDLSALDYYNSVVDWAQQQNFANPVNILETGHSLGGQEADYVDASVSSNANTQYSTQAVTFDAPGLAAGVSNPGVNYDALNISLSGDFVHVGGALLNAGYAGVGVTIEGGVPIGQDEGNVALGTILPNPAHLLVGLVPLAYNGLYVNHVTGPLFAYLQEHPALGGVDLLQYYPTQITQAAIDTMEKTSAATYLSKTAADLAQYFRDILGTPVGPGTGTTGSPPAGNQNPVTGDSGETYTETDSDDTTVLTGSDGSVVTTVVGSGTVSITDNAGDIEALTLNAAGTAVTSDTWTKADGTHGQDTYNADGSESGKLFYADGGYATYIDDGQGNITTDYYTTNGILFSWSAEHSDGTSLSGTQFSNGLTTLSDSTPGNLDVPTSLYEMTVNPDGSSTTVTWSPADQYTTTTYGSSGNVTSTTAGQGNGQEYSQSDLTDTTSTDGLGNTTTQARDSAGDLVWQSWVYADGSSGKTTYYPSDVVVTKDVSASGSSEITISNTGNVTHNYLDTGGNLTSDTWQTADGTSGQDSFNADGSGSGTFDKTDGSDSNVSVDTSLDVTIDNKNSGGVIVSQDWWHADGTHGVTIYNSNESYSEYDYQISGQVKETEYADGGAMVSQETVAGGAIFSPDGSEFGKITNADGSYSINYTDSSGDSLIFNIGGSGVLQSIDHVSAEVASEFSIPTQSGQNANSPYNPSTPVVVGADGTKTIDYLNSSGLITGDDWTGPDGSHGNDIYNSDGSSDGTHYNADGTYYTYSNDGSGNATTEYYDASGDLTSDAWADADGSHGSDQYNADGSSSGEYYAGDGSYVAYADDGNGNVTETNYSADGVATNDDWTHADGSDGDDVFNSDGSKAGAAYQSDGSYLTYSADASGDDLTKYFLASSQLSEQVWKLQGGNGASVTYTFDGAGDLFGQTVTTSAGATLTDSFALSNALSSLVSDHGDGGSVTGSASGGVILSWGDHDSLVSGGGAALIEAGGSDDLVTGGTGDDTLDAFGAGTTLVGGLGNETFEVNDTTDIIQAQAGAASNSMYSSVSYTLPQNVDVLTLTGSGNLAANGNGDVSNVIAGNSGNDTLVAGSGNDTLVTGTGVDFLVGGPGPDAFYLNNASDSYYLPDYNGYEDTIYSSVSYTLYNISDQVDSLTLTGTADLTATDDYGYATLTGNAGNDTLVGGSGADTLIAGSGVDTLVTGTGGNTLVIDNVADVIEVSSGAFGDRIESSVSYSLGDGIDTLVLTGGGDLLGQGNDDATNSISGNSGDDTLIAGSGADTLVAGAGLDTLVAGAGNDVLDGTAARDTYLLNAGFGTAQINLSSGGGTIQFGAGISAADLSVSTVVDAEGNLTVQIADGSSVITLDDGMNGGLTEFSLPGDSGLNFQFGTGPELNFAQFLAAVQVENSTLAGASGNLILSGDSDASLSGGIGGDTIIGSGAGDTIVAGSGGQALYGYGSGDVLAAGVGDDTLHGGGDDTLAAGSGNSILYGGSGTNTYLLAEGGTSTLYASSDASGAQLIFLPAGMTAADFTPTVAPDGDLILQSASGDTTAIIRGFYSSSNSNESAWILADQSGDSQLLHDWVATASSGSTGGSPSGYSAYEAMVQSLLKDYQANLSITLNQMGIGGESLANPNRSSSADQYTFTGVDAQNVTVQGGILNVGSSDSDQSNTTVTQEGTRTYTYSAPVYSYVTIPGSVTFIPASDDSDFVNLGGDSTNPITVGGQTGYAYYNQPETVSEQTGTRVETETVPVYSYYTSETQGFTDYNITGDGGSDVITAAAPFLGTVVTGDGNDVDVDLGLDDLGYWNSVLWGGHLIYYSPESLAPGAFIDVGNGVNDTILGTGNADVIAAGLGFDSIVASLGSTIYVPMEGASTDVIDVINAPYYGSGPFPKSTLVLPEGVTPQDLQVQLVNYDAIGTSEYSFGVSIRLTYGDSTVLLDYDPGSPSWYLQGAGSDDTDGINLVQFSDGTVLTRSQLLTMAGSAIQVDGTYNPVVTQLSESVVANTPVSAADLFTASDASGNSTRLYQISNDPTSGAYFSLNGTVYLAGQAFDVAADQLSQLQYTPGAPGSADTLTVSAFDGFVFGATTTISLPVPAPGSDNDLYQATGPDQTLTGSTDGPDTLIGGYSGDSLVGASGQDTFIYNSGSGAQTISETGPVTSSGTNVLQFGAGITPDSISLTVAAGGPLVATLGSSGDSITIDGFNPANPLASMPIQQFQFADGTSLTFAQLLNDVQASPEVESVTNPDGGVTNYQFAPGGYYAETYNTEAQTTQRFDIYSDGSTEAEAYTYNTDGSSSETDVQTAAGGNEATTTVTDSDAQGNTDSIDITNPDGSTDNTAFVYTDDGELSTKTRVTTTADGAVTSSITGYDAQGRWSFLNNTYSDGSIDNFTYSYGDDGSVLSTETLTPASGDGTTIYAIDSNAQGQKISEDVTSPDGSTTDSTYSYNADGSYVQTLVWTGGDGGDSSTTVLYYDAQGNTTGEDVTNPDGSVDDYTYDSLDRTATLNETYTDGSTSDFTYSYNADGSYVQTEVQSAAGGGNTTTTVFSYDVQDNLTGQDVTNPDGSTDDYTYDSQGRTQSLDSTYTDGSMQDSTYSYNADGSYTQTNVDVPTGGGASTTAVLTYDTQSNLTGQDVTNPDGSTDDITYTYNSDGTSGATEVNTPAGGGAPTTTVTEYNSQGNWVTLDVAYPDGSTIDSSTVYNADGSQVRTDVETAPADGGTTTIVSYFGTEGQQNSVDVTNPDGSTADATYSYNADGSYTATELDTPADGSAATTRVSDYDSNGDRLSVNAYTPSTDGSYSDNWEASDGSSGSYWWNASTREYQAFWYNSDGSYSTDDYQYAVGGSPGGSGVSFTETYTDSSGDQGTRQFDASSGITGLSWYSSATGTETGTTADSGFIGLQNDGELTNTQHDPGFFNPAVTPAFQSFLAGH